MAAFDRMSGKAMAHNDNCRMLTEIPVKDWIGCPATPSSLSSLVGASARTAAEVGDGL